MNKKILFIESTFYDPYGNLTKRKRSHFVGLILPLLAALTLPEWEIEICMEMIEDVPF